MNLTLARSAGSLRSMPKLKDSASASVSVEEFLDVLHVLKRYATQEQIEDLLRLSHGYLSAVKSRKRPVRGTIFLLLMLIAQDPEKRLDELTRIQQGFYPNFLKHQS